MMQVGPAPAAIARQFVTIGGARREAKTAARCARVRSIAVQL